MASDHHVLIKHEKTTWIANFMGVEGFNLELRGVYDLSTEVESEATQFLDALYGVYEEEGLSRSELETLAKSYGIHMREYVDWLQKWEKLPDRSVNDFEKEFELAFLIQRFNEMLYHRATLTTQEIMYATLEQLGEWRVYYVERAKEFYAANIELERKYIKPWEHSSQWNENSEGFRRMAWYVFQIDRRLG
jgi:hypothetical protein